MQHKDPTDRLHLWAVSTMLVLILASQPATSDSLIAFLNTYVLIFLLLFSEWRMQELARFF